MIFGKRRGVSVLVATLLLIAMSVAGGVLVYVFITGLAGNLTQSGGQQVTEKLQIQSFNFQISPGSCGCSQKVIELFLVNTGAGTTVISSVYYDGVLLTLTAPPTLDTPLVNNAFYNIPAATTLLSGTAGNIRFSASTQKTTYAALDTGQVVITFTAAVAYGTGHTVKVVSSTGATNVFTVVSGISG